MICRNAISCEVVWCKTMPPQYDFLIVTKSSKNCTKNSGKTNCVFIALIVHMRMLVSKFISLSVNCNVFDEVTQSLKSKMAAGRHLKLGRLVQNRCYISTGHTAMLGGLHARLCTHCYTLSQKQDTRFLPIISPNANRVSKLFHS